jgi:hypothetical protein
MTIGISSITSCGRASENVDNEEGRISPQCANAGYVKRQRQQKPQACSVVDGRVLKFCMADVRVIFRQTPPVVDHWHALTYR